jgi:hypothetical protein
VAGGPGKKLDELDDPGTFEPDETPTLIPAFDVETFARASEARPSNADSIEAALQTIASPDKAAPAVEVSTAEVDLDTFSDAESRSGLRSRLPSLSRVPVVLPTPSALVGMIRDSREGFLLSLVDGISPLAVLVEASGMPEEQALDMLADLVERGVLGFEGG